MTESTADELLSENSAFQSLSDKNGLDAWKMRTDLIQSAFPELRIAARQSDMSEAQTEDEKEIQSYKDDFYATFTVVKAHKGWLSCAK